MPGWGKCIVQTHSASTGGEKDSLVSVLQAKCRIECVKWRTWDVENDSLVILLYFLGNQGRRQWVSGKCVTRKHLIMTVWKPVQSCNGIKNSNKKIPTKIGEPVLFLTTAWATASSVCVSSWEGSKWGRWECGSCTVVNECWWCGDWRVPTSAAFGDNKGTTPVGVKTFDPAPDTSRNRWKDDSWLDWLDWLDIIGEVDFCWSVTSCLTGVSVGLFVWLYLGPVKYSQTNKQTNKPAPQWDS